MKHRWLGVCPVVMTLLAAGHVPAHAADWRIAAQAEIDAFADQSPHDYTGLDRVMAKYGLPPMKVRVSGVDRVLTAAEAEAELAARDAATDAVPLDAFTVTLTLSYDLYLNRVARGSWNFRDNFVNGSDPDDVATIQSNLGNGCFRTGALVRKAADYTGVDYTGQTYVDDGGVNGSPIFGIRDRASGFKLLTDNGYFRVTYDRTNAGGCDSAQLGAQFQYEHNQDGGAGFSASAGWGFFSISYSSPGDKLRKSTGAMYL